MTVRVKICGITNASDAQAAAEAGADALGFVFFEKSSRFVTVSDAARIASALPPVMKVGVFVNPPEELVLRAIGECGLNMLQFHGEETPEFCTQFGLMSMKAFRVRDADSLNRISEYLTDAWLLDAHSESAPGGTGETFNWALARQAIRYGRPVFLAGGLTPSNVADAVRQVRPFGVDVSSGVESAPGKKDHEKVRQFIQAVRSAGKETEG
ncbi:MAG TPA: phosphoribosylanthranilate isomerase [Verrucomicrobiota bacterium]|nr:phosphoribosylanthranilate isomerase [Verrucomicrobiota bacterium]HOP97456.1 phosphoribosylanthranilate isomerase [Verrucomicrobiota bacterium]